MPAPKEGDALETRIKTAGGAVLGVEAGDWDHEQGGQNTARYQERRFGAEPPAGLVTLHERGFDEVVASVGLTGMFSPRTDGAGRREAYRQALAFSVIAPLGRTVGAELTLKLEHARDAGLARSSESRRYQPAGPGRSQSLVGGGMSHGGRFGRGDLACSRVEATNEDRARIARVHAAGRPHRERRRASVPTHYMPPAAPRLHLICRPGRRAPGR